MKIVKPCLALILCCTMFLSGCGWLSTAESILSAAAPALLNILQIVAVVNGRPMDSGLAAKINGDAANLKTVLSDYAAAQAAAKPGMCPQLQAALNLYESDLPLVMQVAQVSDQNTQSKILILSGLIVGVFNTLEPLIPGCQAPPSASVRTMTANLNLRPATVDLHTFIPAYNAALTSPTGNPTLDEATKRMKLHRHSKAVRIITFGIAK
jgi:hypothetical protein